MTEEIIVSNWRFKETSALRSPWPLWLQVLVFGLVFAALQMLWSSARGTALEYIAVDRATVTPAAWFINLFTPDVHVSPVGGSLRAAGGGINILNGCEGFEVLFLLVAALVVAPLTWLERGVGLLGGALFVWLLNQGRIVVLFYANRADKELFTLLHGTVAPLVLVVTVAIAFLFYLAAVQNHVER